MPRYEKYADETAQEAESRIAQNKAFDALPQDEGSKWFTESYYNTKASPEEKGSYDRKAHKFLRKMFKHDKDLGLVKDLNFDQYKGAMSSSYFTERVDLPRKDDPEWFEQAGDLFFDTYHGDFDQFLESASKWSSDKESAKLEAGAKIKKQAEDFDITPSEVRR
jgi:hypothetical protein